MPDLIDLFDTQNYTVKDMLFLQSLEHRSIIINDEITEELVERVIIPLLNFERDDSVEPVTLYIQTCGGSVSDGLVLCNIIDNYKKPLNIIVLGYALSMGTIILCAGNNNPNVKKYCYPFSYGLHHSGSIQLFGEANSIKDDYEFMDNLNDSINEYIVKNTGITIEELSDNRRKQWYLTAIEMKQKRLVDAIIGVDCDAVK